VFGGFNQKISPQHSQKPTKNQTTNIYRYQTFTAPSSFEEKTVPACCTAGSTTAVKDSFQGLRLKMFDAV